MLRYIISILFLLLSYHGFAQADDGDKDIETDTVDAKTKINKDTLKQFRVETDIGKFFSNAWDNSRKSFEFSADYYWRKELYIVAEGGWGSAHLDDSDLSYSSSNSFFRAGINKSMLTRVLPGDWDMAFVGVRYCMAFIKRNDATYITKDPYWGVTAGTIPGTELTAHWAELVGGVRLELYKGIFTGWTIRGKFLLNKGTLKELPPYAIAGYGKGDRNTVLDFNFHLGYALHWQKKKPIVLLK